MHRLPDAVKESGVVRIEKVSLMQPDFADVQQHTKQVMPIKQKIARKGKLSANTVDEKR